MFLVLVSTLVLVLVLVLVCALVSVLVSFVRRGLVLVSDAVWPTSWGAAWSGSLASRRGA